MKVVERKKRGNNDFPAGAGAREQEEEKITGGKFVYINSRGNLIYAVRALLFEEMINGRH